MAPGRGSQVTISPFLEKSGGFPDHVNEQLTRDCIIANRTRPVIEYPRRIDRGPDAARAFPIPMKRPVPMVPPSAMNWT